MNVETAQVTRQGNRSENQDRADIVTMENRILLTVADGMGGHVGGDVAAETAVHTLVDRFLRTTGSILDPVEFLRASIAEAHHAVVSLGEELDTELRPRTTDRKSVV